MSSFVQARQVVDRFLASRVAPCAVAEVGDRSGPVWRTARGRIRYDDGAPEATGGTVFDLASLTKVLATATVAMRLVEASALDLGARVAELVPAWSGRDRADVTVLDLLAHSSGLPAHRRYYETRRHRSQFEPAICAEPLAYAPRTRAVYSDLGFILLGFILEDVGRSTLAAQFERALATAPRPVQVRFGVAEAWRAHVAPTSSDPRREGVVDDRNAEALGGVAGHAGLFGTADGVGEMARAVLAGRTRASAEWKLTADDATVERFTSRAGEASSRALAWDTALPTSSCGTRMSAQAFGHTGHTGTSLWIDPLAGVYVVLLTNRVYPEPGPPDAIQAFRREFHDAVMQEVARG